MFWIKIMPTAVFLKSIMPQYRHRLVRFLESVPQYPQYCLDALSCSIACLCKPWLDQPMRFQWWLWRNHSPWNFMWMLRSVGSVTSMAHVKDQKFKCEGYGRCRSKRHIFISTSQYQHVQRGRDVNPPAHIASKHLEIFTLTGVGRISCKSLPSMISCTKDKAV